MNEENGSRGLVSQIIHGSFVDGHGVRTTVFLKGCPLRCIWCCNPEGQERHPEIKYTASHCNGCGRCLPVCPTQAISLEAADGHAGPARQEAVRQLRQSASTCASSGPWTGSASTTRSTSCSTRSRRTRSSTRPRAVESRSVAESPLSNPSFFGDSSRNAENGTSTPPSTRVSTRKTRKESKRSKRRISSSVTSRAWIPSNTAGTPGCRTR